MSPPTLSRAATQAADEAAGSARCAGCGCTTNVACGDTAAAAAAAGPMDEIATCWWIRLEPYALCSECATTVDTADEDWPEPRACVAPTWPQWACDEDGEIVWIRADLVGVAAAIILDTGQWDEAGVRLHPGGEAMCWWDRAPAAEFEWTLQEVAEDEDGAPLLEQADELVAYRRFDITYSF